jgi:hypothetical protein
MGKDVGFYMVSRKLEAGRFWKIWQIISLSYIIKVDVQTSKLGNNDTRYGKDGA